MRLKGKLGLRGQYKCIVRNPDGSIDQETDWDDNLITNNGLIIYGSPRSGAIWSSNCYIGDSDTTPTFFDTTLGNLIAAHDVVMTTEAVVGPNATAPLYGVWEINVWRFNADGVTNVIREIAIGISPTNLFSRIVLTTPVTKNPDQVLDVYYKFWVYPDMTEDISTVTIKGVTYDTSLKIVNIENHYNQGTIGSGPAISTFYSPWIHNETAIDGSNSSAVTGGNAINGGSGIATTYTSGSGFTSIKLSLGLGQWNLSTGNIQYVSGLTYVFSWRLKLESQVDGTGVPKDETEILDLTIRFEWDRYTP
jgi:hypothetical protein